MAVDRRGADAEVLADVLEELRRSTETLADESRDLGVGWAVRSFSLPRIWSLNRICLTAPVTFDEVLELAEEHQRDLAFRHVEIEDGATARRLEARFAEAGWRVDREVFQVLRSGPDRQVDTSMLVELSEDQMVGLMLRWIAEERPAISAEGLEQVAEFNRREGRLWGETAFGVVDEAGEPLAVTKWRPKGSTAWVEDVYTVPEARGRGYARALVTHAAGLARAPAYTLGFILADDDDWPKHLYSKIGFEPVGSSSTFHLDLAD